MRWLSLYFWWRKIMELHHLLETWQLDQDAAWVKALKSTRLSALKEALKPKIHYCWRIFWICVFWICFCYGTVLSGWVVRRFLSDRTLVNFHDGIPIENGFAPSYVVNKLYHFKWSEVEEAKILWKKSLDKDGEDISDNYGVTWSKPEILTLNVVMDHTCESKRSISAQFGATDERQHFGIQESLDEIQKFNIVVKDNVTDPLYFDKILPFVKRAIINCEEVIGACIINGIQENDCYKMYTIVQTDMGWGCAINKIPDSVLIRDNGIKTFMHDSNKTMDNKTLNLWRTFNIDTYPFKNYGRRETDPNVIGNIPVRQPIAGLENGHSQVLKFKKDEKKACPIMDGDGYMITVNSPHEQAKPLLDGVLVERNREVTIKTTVHLTLANPSIHDLTIEERECYLQKDNPLTGFNIYTQSNCHLECVARRILDTCKCWELKSSTGKGENICGPLESKCVANVRADLAKNGYKTECGKVNLVCYPACNKVTYTVTSYSIPLDKQNFDRPELLGVDEQTEDWSIVHTFTEYEYMETTEITLYSDYHDLVASIGGILGLTNGIDIITSISLLVVIIIFIIMIIQLFYMLLKIGCTIEAFHIWHKTICIGHSDDEDEDQIPLVVNDNSNGGGNSSNPITDQPAASSDSLRLPSPPRSPPSGGTLPSPGTPNHNSENAQNESIVTPHILPRPAGSRRLSFPSEMDSARQISIRNRTRPFNSAQARQPGIPFVGVITVQPAANIEMPGSASSSRSANILSEDLPEDLPISGDTNRSERLSSPNNFPRRILPAGYRRCSLPFESDSTILSLRKRVRPLISAQAKLGSMSNAGITQIQPRELLRSDYIEIDIDGPNDGTTNDFILRPRRPVNTLVQEQEEETSFSFTDCDNAIGQSHRRLRDTVIDFTLDDDNNTAIKTSETDQTASRIYNQLPSVRRFHQD